MLRRLVDRLRRLVVVVRVVKLCRRRAVHGYVIERIVREIVIELFKQKAGVKHYLVQLASLRLRFLLLLCVDRL